MMLRGRAARLPLRWRVALGFGLGALLVTALLAAVTWSLASDYLLRQRESTAVRLAELNVRLIDASLRAGSDGLEELLQGLSTDSESTVLLRRPDGWTTSGRQVPPRVLPAELAALVERRVPARQRLVVSGVPVLAVTLPTASADSRYVELFPLTQLDRTSRFLAAVLTVGVAASALLGVLLGSWAARRALRPLTELNRAASRVAGGDLRARLPEQDDPDLAPLAATFNRTADALAERVARDARFAGDVSHELRSPLTTMTSAAEVLARRRGDIGGVAGQALDLLLGEIVRFRGMVVDLLEISTEDGVAAPVEPVDLGELVVHVVAARPCGGSAPVLEVAEPAPVVVGDRRRLDRAVANLLDNAARHGGGAVRVGVLHRDGRARLEVDDDGPGVPAAQRRAVFERFARGTAAGRRGSDGGSGLGLALVAQHVHRHDGAVWVEDRPGGGARFVIELPEAER
jgi:signal transduction histidine kinase